jgi:hypothetical protein
MAPSHIRPLALICVYAGLNAARIQCQIYRLLNSVLQQKDKAHSDLITFIDCIQRLAKASFSAAARNWVVQE